MMGEGNRHVVMPHTLGRNEAIFKEYIRDIPDFPKKGVLFKDITPLLNDGDIFSSAIFAMTQRFCNEGINLVVCPESRGFIIGTALANSLGCGIVPVRKKGKLPHKCCSETYNLEYGTDTLEMHEDAIRLGQKVLVVDDVLATGGTAKAVVNLVSRQGGKIACAVFLLELSELNGRNNIGDFPVYSLIIY